MISLCFLSLLHAQTSVWKVSDGRHTMYLGGTVHLLKPSDYPLPEEFYEAYEESHLLVFETDIEAIGEPEFVEMIASRMFLDNDKKLKDVISRKSYDMLEEYLVSQGKSIDLYERLKPWTVAMNLTAIRLEELGITAKGVDDTFSKKARSEGKPQIGLESMGEHVRIITSMGGSDDDQMIAYTIRDMQTLPEMIDWLLADWRKGDLRRMKEEAVETMQRDFPKVYKTILADRNDAWMKKLLPMMRDGRVEFVLVGTLHMVGRDGLIEQFRRRGYKVEPY
ncbi:MAG: TraB/GumN family protein [Sulfurimonadaceae bacterium]|nr:TraB/GumN family protein [Sulfurimonadaceae bacterium]